MKSLKSLHLINEKSRRINLKIKEVKASLNN